MFLERGTVHVHLSEHTGDATSSTLVYLWVDDVDAVAEEFDLEVVERLLIIDIAHAFGIETDVWAHAARPDDIGPHVGVPPSDVPLVVVPAVDPDHAGALGRKRSASVVLGATEEVRMVAGSAL